MLSRKVPSQKPPRPISFYVAVALLLGMSVVTQLQFPLSIQCWGVSPDLVLVVVVAAGLLQGSIVGAVVGFAGAYLLSSIGPFSPGSIFLSHIVVGYLAGLVVFRAYTDHPLVSAGAGFLGGVLAETIFYVLNPKDARVWLEGALVCGAYAFVLTPLAYFFLRRFVD
nr:hypothetical protein [Armatimonadota bacterium]